MRYSSSVKEAQKISETYPSVALLVECFAHGIPPCNLDVEAEGRERKVYERLCELLHDEATKVRETMMLFDMTWMTVVETPRARNAVASAIVVAASISSDDDDEGGAPPPPPALGR